MKITQLHKEYKDKHCPICAGQMKNHYAMRITIPIEVDICGDCAYERKEFLWWLSKNLPAAAGDLKNLGVALPTPHTPAQALHCSYVN